MEWEKPIKKIHSPYPTPFACGNVSSKRRSSTDSSVRIDFIMGCQETSANIAKYERKIGPTFFGIELRGVRLLPAPRRRTSRKIDKIWQCHFCYWYIVYYVFSIVAFSIAFAFSADSPNGLDLKLDDSRDPNKQRNEHARMYARACVCVCFLIWFERKMLMMLSAVASDVCVTLHTQMSTWAHVAMERTGRIEEKALAQFCAYNSKNRKFARTGMMR